MVTILVRRDPNTRRRMTVGALVATGLLCSWPPIVYGQTDDSVLVDEIAWVNPPEVLPPNTKHGTFNSPSMGFEVGYSIYVPDSSEVRTSPYPVVYWLHGRGGSEAHVQPIPVLHSAIEQNRVEPIVLVIVNGGVASGYIDNAATGVMGESVVLRELVPHIEATYPVRSDPAGRGIGGMSMGGAGAVRMALRFPETFGAVVSVAGALFNYTSIMERHWVPNATLARSYDPYVQATLQAERLRKSLPLKFFIGTNDQWLEENRRFQSHLDDLAIPYLAKEIDGVEHNFVQYLDAVGPEIFEFYSVQLSSAN